MILSPLWHIAMNGTHSIDELLINVFLTEALVVDPTFHDIIDPSTSITIF